MPTASSAPAPGPKKDVKFRGASPDRSRPGPAPGHKMRGRSPGRGGRGVSPPRGVGRERSPSGQPDYRENAGQDHEPLTPTHGPLEAFTEVLADAKHYQESAALETCGDDVQLLQVNNSRKR